MKKIEIRPIGTVRADDSAGRYALEIEREHRDGLAGLGEFGRVNVLWWAHCVDDPKMRGTLVRDLP